MRKELLEYLACPLCRAPLALGKIVDQQGEEIVNGDLFCSACTVSYPIVRAVPRLLPPDLKLSTSAKGVNIGFGYQWNKFPKIEPSDRGFFLNCIKPIKSDFFADKVILDAGCGMGRFAYHAGLFGAKMVIGMDFSSAVEAAAQNCKGIPNIQIIQGEITRPPLRPEVLDYVYSLGVLHHLPEPERGFASLLPLLKQGGAISAWVYGKEGNGWVRFLVTPLRVVITSLLPKRLLLPITWLLGTILYVAVFGVYQPMQKWFPSLLRFLPYNNYLLGLVGDTHQQFVGVVFDHLHTPISFYYSGPEFERWFTRSEIAKFVVTPFNGYSWCGMGIKR
jgi:uncharacterized protein YbaR (Trm112 family)/ubiquinone/menaquinone biosynthesis C-methylase UbiE